MVAAAVLRAAVSGGRPGSLAMMNADVNRRAAAPAGLQPRLLAGLLLCLGLLPTARAAEVDLSCASHTALGKIQVAERYKEYDVVLHNRCPGPLYWSMCIERIDPQSHEIVEVHTPSGFLEAEQKSRVNLQLKKGPERMAFR
jgi:hypothetical protein